MQNILFQHIIQTYYFKTLAQREKADLEIFSITNFLFIRKSKIIWVISIYPEIQQISNQWK